VVTSGNWNISVNIKSQKTVSANQTSNRSIFQAVHFYDKTMSKRVAVNRGKLNDVSGYDNIRFDGC